MTFLIARIVESQQFDQPFRVFRSTENTPVASHSHSFARETFQRIGNSLRTLSQVARLATVEQVVVTQAQFRVFCNGNKVLDMEVSERRRRTAHGGGEDRDRDQRSCLEVSDHRSACSPQLIVADAVLELIPSEI